MDRLIAGYMRSLVVALRWRRSMLAVTFGFVALTVWLYTVVPRGFFPDQDSGLIFGFVQAQPDTSFQQMTVYQQRVMEVIRADPAVENVSAAVGGGGFFGSSASVRLQLTLVPQGQRPGVKANDVINRLRRPLAAVTGVQTFMRPVSDIIVGGRQGNASYQYVLLTPDIDELFTWSEALVNQLRTVPQVEDVSSDQQRTGLVSRLVIDRDAAARLGISVQALDAALNNAFAQRQVSTIYRTRNQYRVVLEIDPLLTEAPENLDRIFLPGRAGPVPLGAVARLERGISPRTITHQGLFPAATITFNLAEGVSLGEAAAAIEQAALAIQMPASIRGGIRRQCARLPELPVRPAAADPGGDRRDLHRARRALREPDPSADDHLDPADRGHRRPAGAAGDRAVLHADRADRRHPADGHREEECHHDGRFRAGA